MYSILITVNPPDQEAAIAELWEHATIGLIEESPTSLRAYFSRPEEVAEASKIFDNLLLEVRKEEAFTNFPTLPASDPILVGNRFVILSPGMNAALPQGRLRITVDPQSGFGSGRHESTQLMIQALEKYVEEGHAVLDVGCGSAILSLAARMLGATGVFACDIDANAIHLGHREHKLPVFEGSADAVQTACVDLVLANISASVIDAMAPDLNRVAKPDGRILISGFVSNNLPHRFQPERVLELRDWQCWICRRDPVLAVMQTVPAPHSRQWW